MMQGPRYEKRKKQRVNRMLNIAIGIVVVLIVIFGAQILFSPSAEETAGGEEENTTTNNELEDKHTIPDPVEKDDDEMIEVTEGKDDLVESDDTLEEDDDKKEEDIEIDEEELELVPDGEWDPIGTKQDGEFSHDFNKDSQNWSEMTRAIRYATGLDDSMIIWRLENGGGETKARGVVSAPDKQEHPYEVYIEWIDGEGWLPIEKNQLESNPYRR